MRTHHHVPPAALRRIAPILLLSSISLFSSVGLAAGSGQYSSAGEAAIGTLLLAPDQPVPSSQVEVRALPDDRSALLHSGPGVTLHTEDDDPWSFELEEHVHSLRVGAEEWQIAVFEKQGDWVRIQLADPLRVGWIRIEPPARFGSLAEIFHGRTGFFTRGIPELMKEPGSQEKASRPSHTLSFAGLVRAPPMPANMPRDAALPYSGLVRVFARKNESDQPLHHFARSNTESWIASFQDGEHLFDRAIPILRQEDGWLQAAVPHEDAMSFPLRREKYQDVKVGADGTRRVWILANEVGPLEPVSSEEIEQKSREAVRDRYLKDVKPDLVLGDIREFEGRQWIHVKTFTTLPGGDPFGDQVSLGEGWLPLLDGDGKFTVWFYVSAC